MCPEQIGWLSDIKKVEVFTTRINCHQISFCKTTNKLKCFNFPFVKVAFSISLLPQCCAHTLLRLGHKIDLVMLRKTIPVWLKNTGLGGQTHRWRWSSFLKNIQWCYSSCGRSFGSLVGCNNANVFPSTSCCDRWLISI